MFPIGFHHSGYIDNGNINPVTSNIKNTFSVNINRKCIYYCNKQYIIIPDDKNAIPFSSPNDKSFPLLLNS